MAFVIKNFKYGSYLRVEEGKCHWDSYFRSRPDRPTTVFNTISEMVGVIVNAVKLRPENWPPKEFDWIMEEVGPVIVTPQYAPTGKIIA